MNKQIHLIDYGFGNLASVKNALEFLNYNCKIIDQNTKLNDISHLILPGVGSFEAGIKALKSQKWDKKIYTLVENNVKLLGICLGMQLLFKTGHNEKNKKKIEGLKLIDGVCENFFKNKNNKLPLPHVGFNKVNFTNSKIWDKNKKKNNYFYFIHSHRIKILNEKKVIIATSKYGENFVSYVEKENIFGAQFHPEKSNRSGLIFLKNFCELK